MNIVIAPDSFKGSMTSIQAAESMHRAVKDIFPKSNVITKPMADGGEGTLDIMLNASTKGKKIPIICTGPLGEKRKTYYGMLDNKTAIIECANIAGLTYVPENHRNPDYTTSYGIGEVIKDALNRECKSMIIGVGGSATNDGGFGMLQALGMSAKDREDKHLGSFGKDFLRVSSIDLEKIDPRLSSVHIRIASDVGNVLCGSNGATAIYGPQKGADDKQIQLYDRTLEGYSALVESYFEKSFKDTPGAGAAGGLGFAFLALGAEIISGAKLIAEQTLLEEAVKQADLVLTGEGQSDMQTLFGKAPGCIAEFGVHYNVPVVLVSGALTGDVSILQEKFSGCFSISNRPMLLKESMNDAETLLHEQVKQVMHFWNCILNHQYARNG